MYVCVDVVWKVDVELVDAKDQVDVVGAEVDVVGAGVDVVGAEVDVVGAEVDVVGAEVDVVGAEVDVVGAGVDVVGAGVDVVGEVGVTGSAYVRNTLFPRQETSLTCLGVFSDRILATGWRVG